MPDAPTEREAWADLYAHPTRWPANPFLPLYRDSGPDVEHGGAVLGLLISGKGHTVYLCNMVDALVAYYHAGSKLTSKEFKRWLGQQGFYRYDSLDELWDNDWKVD